MTANFAFPIYQRKIKRDDSVNKKLILVHTILLLIFHTQN